MIVWYTYFKFGLFGLFCFYSIVRSRILLNSRLPVSDFFFWSVMFRFPTNVPLFMNRKNPPKNWTAVLCFRSLLGSVYIVFSCTILYWSEILILDVTVQIEMGNFVIFYFPQRISGNCFWHIRTLQRLSHRFSLSRYQEKYYSIKNFRIEILPPDTLLRFQRELIIHC